MRLTVIGMAPVRHGSGCLSAVSSITRRDSSQRKQRQVTRKELLELPGHLPFLSNNNNNTLSTQLYNACYTVLEVCVLDSDPKEFY